MLAKCGVLTLGDAAEPLHRQLKHILGVKDMYSTANVVVLAKLGRFHLQQILRYHNCINNCDDECLIKCAFVEDMHSQAHLCWSHKVSDMHGFRKVSAVLLSSNSWSQNTSQNITFQQSRDSRAKKSSAVLSVAVMVFM